MLPIILAFNIRHSVYREFGLQFFKHAQKYFNMHLLPIVTLPGDGIEQRALRLSRAVPEMLGKLGVEAGHFACYSSSGIDMRFGVAELGLAKYVRTLTTISSPHRGSKLALLSDRKFFSDEVIDPISRLTGVGLKAFHQFVPENMKHFNSFVHNAKNVQYYSLGSQKLSNLCSYSLSQTGKYLLLKTQPNFQYHNDGVFGHDEITWGKHLTNFEADHGEVIGIYGANQPPALHTVRQIAQDWEKRNQSKDKDQKEKGKEEAARA